MRFVFICPDIDFIRLQYSDFDAPDKGLVLFDRRRRFFTILSLIGITSHPSLDWLSRGALERYFNSIKGMERFCFIIYARAYESFRSSICRYLRNKYPGCKVIVYYGDLIYRHHFKVEDIAKEVDAVFSFDEIDAKDHGVKWLLEPFSLGLVKKKSFSQEKNPFKWDVTFVGHAKNRYEKIIRMYEILTGMGLKCDFHITGVPKSERKYVDKIHYKGLDFKTLLQHVVSSKCVAEIMQEKGISPTTRYTEAMLFGRNLLTNCEYFRSDENRPENVFYFEQINDLNNEMQSEIVKNHLFERESYCEMFSIETMINSIEKSIEL